MIEDKQIKELSEKLSYLCKDNIDLKELIDSFLLSFGVIADQLRRAKSEEKRISNVLHLAREEQTDMYKYTSELKHVIKKAHDDLINIKKMTAVGKDNEIPNVIKNLEKYLPLELNNGK